METGEGAGRNTEIREHLANERTLLSWIRTGVSLISIGLVVERAGALTQLGQKIGPASASDLFGLALAMLGTLALLLGTAQFLRNRREIHSGQFASSVGSYLVIVAGSLLLAGAFVVYVILS